MPDAPFIRESDGATRHGKILLTGQGWSRDIATPDLTFILIAFQTRLQFGDVEIVIGSNFVLTLAGTDHALDPEARNQLGPLLGIYPDSLTSGGVDANGTLRLDFASGASIAVPSDPQYEAWNIVGPGAALVVCMPGTSGELAIWS